MMSSALYSQSALTGLGVEIGGGYNQIFAQYFTLPFHGMKFERTHFALTPEVRLNYEFRLADQLTCFPFAGYNRFGGKSEDSPVLQDGMKFAQDALWFDALEIGFLASYHISDLSFGVGYKANGMFKATMTSYDPEIPDSRVVTDGYRTWSHDAGIRASYKLSQYSVSAEAWFGISNMERYSEIHNIRQNHFRILLGYTI